MILISASARVLPRQLPTYNGTKSYQNLLVEVYGGENKSLNGSHLDAIIQNNSINLFRSGRYEYSSGNTLYRGTAGDYWQSNILSEDGARNLAFYSTYLYPQYGSVKGYGFTLRCLVR